ncbi:RHS repeat domain-containing protein [Myxococcus vastator]|uniref:RHS repeat domain-containing protein n=1 Tax=Myxococcus vastator TaxID=2709664 RepID=UPI001F083879|nr:RHS repeat-associated core domain-containing protein [Myxococcus vastator]
MKYRLTSIVAPTGHRVSLTYGDASVDGSLTRVYDDASGRLLQLEYQREVGRLRLSKVELHHATSPDATVTTFLDACVQYRYDGQRSLASASRYESACDDGGYLYSTESYLYESERFDAGRTRLSQYTGPNGEVTRYTYYGSTDVVPGEDDYLLLMKKDERVRSVAEVLEASPLRLATTVFSYSISQELRTVLGQSLPTFVTTVKGPRVEVPQTVYRMGLTGAVVETEKPLSQGVFARTGALWDPVHRTREAEEDGRGRVTRYEYDERGDLIARRIKGKVLPASGPSEPTVAVVGIDGLPVTEVVEKWGYEPGFNTLVCHVDAEGYATVSRVDSSWDDPVNGLPSGTGQILETRRYATKVSRQQLVSASSCEEIVSSLPQTPSDTVLSWRYCDVEGVVCPAHARRGDWVENVGADGHVDRATAYNVQGNLQGKTIQVSGASVVTVRYGYDARGRVAWEEDSQNNHRSWEWNADNRLGYEDIHGYGTLGVVRIVEYYPGGQVKREQFGFENRLYREHKLDAAGRLATTVEKYFNDGWVQNEIRYTHDDAGNKVGVVDRRGVRTSIEYDYADRPVEMTVFVENASRFISQGGSHDEVGRTYTKSRTAYDAVGNKVWEADVSGFERTYLLDSLYRVVEERSPEVPGESDTSPRLRYTQGFAYDLMGRRVRHVDGNGYASTVEHDHMGRAAVLSDPIGRVERRSYDGRGNITVARWEAGGLQQRMTTTSYDGLGRELSISEQFSTELGQEVYETQKVYDDTLRTVWTRDARGFLHSKVIDALGRDYKVVVDAASGPLTRQPNDPRAGVALGLSEVTAYDHHGYPVFKTDALGRITDTVHDPFGRLVAVHRPMGVSEKHFHDGEGHVIRSVDGRTLERRFTYDALGRPRSEILIESLSQEGQPLTVRQHTYFDTPNSEGLTREEIRDARGSLTTLFRDGLGREVRRTDALGYSWQTWFDALYKRQEKDAKGYVTRFTYDGVGRPLSQSEYQPGQSSPAYTQSWEHADASRSQTHVDRRGTPTVTSLDGLGRKVGSTRGLGEDTAEEAWGYDAAGHVVWILDANGHSTERVYDGAGRLVEETRGIGEPESATTKFQYDAAGQLTQQKGPRATGTAYDFRYTYDDLGRQVREEDANHHVAVRSYDAAGNLVCAKQPLGNPSLAHGAAQGLTIAQVMPYACNGAYVTRHAYDEEGKLVSLTDAAGGVYSYVYDAVRNLVAKQDANGNLTTYEYDPRSLRTAEHQHLDFHARLTSAQRAAVPLFEGGATSSGNVGTLTWRHTHDANGNPGSLVDPKGQRTDFEYGMFNRLRKRVYSLHAAPREFPSVDSEEFVRDGNGNVTRELQVKAVVGGAAQDAITSTYDALGRLKTQLREYDGKLISVEHDAVGNRTQVVDSDGVATAYAYDSLGRLSRATLPSGVVEYSYWPDSLLKRAVWPNGVSEGRCYDAVGQLVELLVVRGTVGEYCATSGVMLSRYLHVYDGNGNRVMQQEARTSPSTQVFGPDEVTSYGYDVLGRLTGVKTDGAYSTLYRLDAVGNRTGERRVPSFAVTTLGPEAYSMATPSDLTHDAVATFSRVDWLRSVVDVKDSSRNSVFDYDLVGNLRQRTAQGGTRSLAWDIRNTLTAVYDNGQEVGRYDYDINLQRMRRSTSTENVEYVVDSGFVLQELNASLTGSPTYRRYHYGVGPLAVADGGAGAGATLRFLGSDGLGSVSDATSASGEMVAARKYDAWGNHRDDTHPSAGEFKIGYTGHQFDVETGFTYARARYYDSELGRFVSRDSYGGQLDDAPSLHRYAYANGNPLRFVDPTGHWSTEEFVYGLGDAVRGVINSGIGAVRPLAAMAGGATGEFDENWSFQLGQTDTWHGELSNSVGGMVAAVTTVVEDPVGTASRVVDATGQMLGEGAAALYMAATEDGIVGDAASREFGRRAPDLIGTALGVGGTAKGVKVVGESAIDAAKRQVAKRGARNAARESAEAIGNVDRHALARAGAVGDDVVAAKFREVEVSAPEFSDLDEWYQYKERYVDPQAFIDGFVVDSCMRVKFSFRPNFDPKLKSSGKVRLDVSTHIGHPALVRDSELFKTLAHEESHHRLNARAKRGSERATRLRRNIEVEEDYVEEVAKRYFRKKSLKRTFAH